MDRAASGVYRTKVANQHHRVSFVELFFDLVFVFAITQVSHSLSGHYSPAGAGQALFLLLAVWWVWVYTSWVMNWLNPEHVAVRLMLFILMLAGLLMSVSIPHAFEGGGLIFGLAYSFTQVMRTAFFVAVVPAADRAVHQNFQRILVWLCVSALFWIGGGLAHGQVRVVLWLVAFGIEFIGPFALFWTPGLGASSIHDWNIEGGHLAERCGLFVIIALGESILITGSTFAGQTFNLLSLTAFFIAFIGSLAMWWIYFDKGAELGARQMAASDDPGRQARLAYTYLHLPIIGGIVVAAVADDFLLAHPRATADISHALTIVGGPALFLAGVVCFKHTLRGWYQPSHLAGLGAFILLFVVVAAGVTMSQLALSVWAALVLIVVSAWEYFSLADVEEG